MKIDEVIEARSWINKLTGQRASIYGAVPWRGADKDDWSIVVTGYTWRLSNGTIGLGRKPAATREEAEEIARRHNLRFSK